LTRTPRRKRRRQNRRRLRNQSVVCSFKARLAHTGRAFFNMKKILLIGAAAAAAAAAWYFWKTKTGTAAKSGPATPPVQNRAGTALWYGGQVNAENLAATTATVQGAFASLSTISNAFGINFGGKSGVSVNGSAAGGTASSGSGAGLPSSGGASLVVSPALDGGNGDDNGSGYSDTSAFDDFAFA